MPLPVVGFPASVANITFDGLMFGTKNVYAHLRTGSVTGEYYSCYQTHQLCGLRGSTILFINKVPIFGSIGSGAAVHGACQAGAVGLGYGAGAAAGLYGCRLYQGTKLIGQYHLGITAPVAIDGTYSGVACAGPDVGYCQYALAVPDPRALLGQD